MRLRFANPTLLEPMTEALAHAVSAPVGDPDLEVDIWDSASAGQETLRPRWGPDAYLEHGAVDGYFDDELQVVFSHGSGAINVMFPERRRAIYWLPSADRFPDIERGSPLRTVLHLWLVTHGDQLVHAAALGSSEGCVLIAGRGGSGKSSTALACLGSAVGHIADDYCVLEPGEPDVIHILYSSVKARPDTVARLGIDPAMVANPDRPDDEKAIVFLAEHEPERLVSSAPVKAVAFPVATGLPETSVRPGIFGPGPARAGTEHDLPTSGPWRPRDPRPCGGRAVGARLRAGRRHGSEPRARGACGDAARVSGRTAIVTLAVGAEYERQWRTACERNWATYAERHGYDVICLTEPLDLSDRAASRSPSWQKLLVLGQPFAADYDRVIWVDADMLFNPEAPALVDGIPAERVGAVDESGDSRPRDAPQHDAQALRALDGDRRSRFATT